MSRKINVISRKIDKEDRAMLRDLLEVGSATPDKFEVKTGRIGPDVRIKLDDLYARRLIGRSKSEKVFYPTVRTLWSAYFS